MDVEQGEVGRDALAVHEARMRASAAHPTTYRVKDKSVYLEARLLADAISRGWLGRGFLFGLGLWLSGGLVAFLIAFLSAALNVPSPVPSFP